VVSSLLGVGVGGTSPNSGGAGVGGSSRLMWSGGGAPGSSPSLKQLYYIRRLTMDQSLFGFHVTWCAQMFSLA
jgi:hypothetical protein